jgi:hypothetical protein
VQPEAPELPADAHPDGLSGGAARELTIRILIGILV